MSTVTRRVVSAFDCVFQAPLVVIWQWDGGCENFCYVSPKNKIHSQWPKKCVGFPSTKYGVKYFSPPLHFCQFPWLMVFYDATKEERPKTFCRRQTKSVLKFIPNKIHTQFIFYSSVRPSIHLSIRSSTWLIPTSIFMFIFRKCST